MYESLLEWCTAPVGVSKAGARKASGDQEFTSPVTYMCYRADEVVVVTDKTGKEYVSGTQLFLSS